MEKGQTVTAESFINNWNLEFPQYPLKLDDLKKPQALMEALFQIFDRLGIDQDFILAPPSEECSNESTAYYWDLLPVINMTRALNHLTGCSAVMPQLGTISIMQFLQPMLHTSKYLILILCNLALFYESRLNEIGPNEDILFAKVEHVKTLESKKNKLLEMLNKQAEENGKRAERLEKLTEDVKQFEEELKQEKEIHNEEKQELEPILKENHQTELLLEQKKSHRDALLSEVSRKKALRVYDADDIKAQAEQASQNVQEAEEKLNILRSALMQKENSLKNLQTVKPSLDTANNLLQEIMKLTDSLKDYETGDLDTEGELDVLNNDLFELEAQLSELQAARAEAADKRQESLAKRQNERSQALSALREAEEKDRRCRSRAKNAAQRTEEIKELTLNYEKQKTAGLEELAAIKNTFCSDIKLVEDLLINKIKEVEKRVEETLLKRNL